MDLHQYVIGQLENGEAESRSKSTESDIAIAIEDMVADSRQRSTVTCEVVRDLFLGEHEEPTPFDR